MGKPGAEQAGSTLTLLQLLGKKERWSFSKVFLQCLALKKLSPKAAGTLRGSHCMCAHV